MNRSLGPVFRLSCYFRTEPPMKLHPSSWERGAGECRLAALYAGRSWAELAVAESGNAPARRPKAIR